MSAAQPIPDTMRIAELRGPQDFVVLEAPTPSPGPGELLVAVDVCGVCASELDLWLGHSDAGYPARIGHEVAGTVVAVGPGCHGAVSDRVAVWTAGHGYADFVVVAETDCRPMPAHLPTEQGLVEPIACATNAVDLAEVRLADSVVVLGAGFMGLLVTQLVRLRGPRSIIVADHRPDALRLALRAGATRTVCLAEESLTEVVGAATGGRGADITFEVTGSQGALDVLGEVTRMSGKLVLVGFHQGRPRAVPLGHWNWMAFDIRNAHFRDPAVIARGMTAGIALLQTRQLDLAPLITHRFDLDHIGEAFATAVAKPEGFVKAVVTAAGHRAERERR